MEQHVPLIAHSSYSFIGHVDVLICGVNGGDTPIAQEDHRRTLILEITFVSRVDLFLVFLYNRGQLYCPLVVSHLYPRTAMMLSASYQLPPTNAEIQHLPVRSHSHCIIEPDISDFRPR
jgi:hypothetical protein